MALEKLITENYDRLYNFIYAQLRDRFDAEDAASETVLIAISRFDTLRDEEKALAWLFGIARNVVSRYRSKTRSEFLLPEEAELADTESMPLPEAAVQTEEAEKIKLALSHLSKNYRRIMVERYFDEKSYREISGAFAIPMPLVSYRLNEGKKLLKEEFIKMDTAKNNSYYKPQDMQLDVRYTGKLNIARLSYEVMNNLLAKNIAFVCCDKPLTVTEIAHTLGVAADYVEETLEKMLRLFLLERKSNRYQTAFPIITGQMLDRIEALAVPESSAMYAAVTDEMKKAIPSILGLDEMAGFRLSEKQAMYFIYIGMRSHNDNWITPYDQEVEYPNQGFDCKWVHKAYMPPDAGNRHYRIWQYQLVSDAERERRVHFIFDPGLLVNPGSDQTRAWQDITMNENAKTIFDIADGKTPAAEPPLELLKTAGILNERGTLACLYFTSITAHEKAFEAAAAAVKLRNDLMARSKDRLIAETKKLFLKRFQTHAVYINCEIRDTINYGFEQYMLKNNLLEPVNYLILDREPQKSSDVHNSYL
jgi:RNA polymerase sigma factor (sigma-70 family)